MVFAAYLASLPEIQRAFVLWRQLRNVGSEWLRAGVRFLLTAPNYYSCSLIFAVDVVHGGQDEAHFLARQAVVNRLPVAAGGDEFQVSHLGKMLRYRTLADATCGHQFVDGFLATDEHAEDQQAGRVGHGAQQFRRLVRLGSHLVEFKGAFGR